MFPGLDTEILLSLWKWKLLSMAAIAEEFFGTPYSDAAYKRMRSLRRKKLVERACLNNTEDFFWTLSAKGFDTIREFLPPMAEVGFRSESQRHDFIVSALHRGPWLAAVPDGVRLISEQELRRLEGPLEDIPPSDLHRPDGYTVISDGEQLSITALEVELSRKNISDYARVSSHYSVDEVTRVLWLVPKNDDADWILDRIREFHPDRVPLHQFVTLSDFVADFWDARVSLGTELGRSIHELFDVPASHLVLTGEKPAVLDTRRRPYSSIIYADNSNSPTPKPSRVSRSFSSNPKPKGPLMQKVIPITLLGLALTSCASKPNIKTKDTLSKEANVPSLTSPEVRRIWVPEKIDGNKFIKGHYMYVIDKPSVWSK